MKMMDHMTKVIIQLFLANLVPIILYIVKFRRPVSAAMPNNSLVIMPTWKPSAKFFTYVPTIRLTISFVQTEQFSINNFSFVYGGINSTVTLHQAFII